MKGFKFQDSRFKPNGFTFVEIAMVVGILALLSSIVIVNLNIRGNKANANNIKRRTDLESIQSALDLRAQETGDSLPTGLVNGLSEKCVGVGSDSFNLSNISWATSVGADIKFDVRSCDDAGCVGETWPGTPAYSSSPATLNITNAPYFQYKATYNVTEAPWDQTSDTDFNAGTNASTVVFGAGAGASVVLAPVEIPNTETGLVGLWHLNGTVGTIADNATVADTSGNNNNGTVYDADAINTITYQTSSLTNLNQAINFDGANDYINIGDLAAVEGQSALTMESWIKPNAFVNGASWLSKSSSSMSNLDLMFSGISGAFLARVTNSATTSYGTTGNVLTIGAWYHIVMVFNGLGSTNADRLKVYVNGVLQGLTFTGTIPVITPNNTASLFIGKYNAYFTGSIDEAAIYNRTLTAAEIAEHFRKSTGTYTSAVKDTGQASDFTTVSWTSTIPSPATSMSIEMQSANLSAGADCATGTIDWAGGSGWQSVATITTANGNSSANIPSTLDGKRCVQYRATLNTTSTSQTPSLDSITIKYFPGASKPVLNDATITATSSLLGDARTFTSTTYNDFLPGIINLAGTLAITGSASPNDAAQGTVEYSTGSPPMTYTSPVISGNCYDLTADLAPLYLGAIPKDPKTGTDANTGYLISVDPATKVVCVKAPGAENGEVIENCRK